MDKKIGDVMPDDMSGVGGDSEAYNSPAIGRERFYSALVLFGVALFTLGDLVEDRLDGAPWSHVLSELVIVLIATCVGSVLFRRSRIPLEQRSRLLELQLTRARTDARRWKSEASQILKGLSAAITQQLDEWDFSDAEKDIAMLLLKGLSHREIAEIRNTSERTVRQQSTVLYQKSGLAGRAELSAFFLEDLLAPTNSGGEAPTSKSENGKVS